MNPGRFWIVPAIVLATTLSACGQASAPPAPTAAPQAKVATTAPASTAVPAAAPTQAAAAPTKVPAAAPTAQPKPSPAAVAAAPTTATSGVADLIARASGLGDYTYDLKMVISGATSSGKAFVKGSKMRLEMETEGVKGVAIMDTSTKTAYMLMPDQKMAAKVDFGMVQVGGSPTDQVTGMPADVKVVGSDTIDGKSTTVIEHSKDGTTTRMWIWTEKGVPLKANVNGPGTQATMEYSNYQFAPLDAGLFEPPKDFTVTDMAAGGIPGGSGQIPIPAVKP